MYNAILEWVNIPFKIKPFLSIDGAADKTYSDDVDALCYPEKKVNVVVDNTGKEVVSSTMLYIDGHTLVTNNDLIVFENKTWVIKSIAGYYDKGTLNIQVVYL